MKYIYKPILSVLALATLLLSCNKDEDIIFDSPYISIEALNSSSRGPISTEQQFVAEYMLYLNAPAPKKEVSVTYEFVVGDGLEEGVDYELLTKETTQTFLQGIYDLPIRIKWLKTCERDEKGNIVKETLDDKKDVSLQIILKSNSENYTLGNPGPAQNNKKVEITKVKAK